MDSNKVTPINDDGVTPPSIPDGINTQGGDTTRPRGINTVGSSGTSQQYGNPSVKPTGMVPVQQYGSVPPPPYPQYNQQYYGQGQQMQQPNYFVVAGQQPAPIIVQPAPKKNTGFGRAITLSCLAFWFCGGLFGLIAFILAMIGRSVAEDGNESTGRKFRTASYVFTAIGVITGITLITLIVLSVTNTSSCESKSYGSCSFGRYWTGTCYKCCDYSLSCGYVSYYGRNPMTGSCCYLW